MSGHFLIKIEDWEDIFELNERFELIWGETGLKAYLIKIVLIILLWVGWSASPALSANLSDGEKLFNANCTACHWGGGNVVIPSKTLQKSALEKYKMASLSAIKTQIKYGKSAMPAFQGRLNDQQVEDIAAFVLKQAKRGW